jgi:hypothetical protein
MGNHFLLAEVGQSAALAPNLDRELGQGDRPPAGRGFRLIHANKAVTVHADHLAGDCDGTGAVVIIAGTRPGGASR